MVPGFLRVSRRRVTTGSRVVGGSRWRLVRPSTTTLHFQSTHNMTAPTSIWMNFTKAHIGESGHSTAPRPHATARPI